MDNEEIQREIDSISADRDALERTRNKLTGDIALLLQQIEAKKPKRRHGDFGFDNNSFGRLSLKGIRNQMFSAGSGCCYDQDRGDKQHPKLIFGNIFDLLKEWSEDLEHFEFDVHKCEINTVEFAHAPIHIAGNWHTLAEAEEIWHNLGRVIATLKRKQS